MVILNSKLLVYQRLPDFPEKRICESIALPMFLDRSLSSNAPFMTWWGARGGSLSVPQRGGWSFQIFRKDSPVVSSNILYVYTYISISMYIYIPGVYMYKYVYIYKVYEEYVSHPCLWQFLPIWGSMTKSDSSGVKAETSRDLADDDLQLCDDDKGWWVHNDPQKLHGDSSRHRQTMFKW